MQQDSPAQESPPPEKPDFVDADFGNDWLTNMHEIALPDPVPMLPQSWGWWMPVMAVLLLLLWKLWCFYRIWRFNAYRRAALRELDALPDAASGYASLPAILKRVALHSFGRPAVAGLSGAAWTAFLNAVWAGGSFDDSDAELLRHLAVTPAGGPVPSAIEPLLEKCRAWIRQHAAKEGPW